jgi:hypothetical protein
LSGYVWDFSGTDNRRSSYGPGHQIHWIHFNHSMREPSVVIPVTAVVDDDGLVHIEGDDVSLVRRNHRPALLHAALDRFGGMADWKPRWHLLLVPTEAVMGSARSVFNLAEPDERRECRALHSTNPDHLIPSKPSPTNVPPGCDVAVLVLASHLPDARVGHCRAAPPSRRRHWPLDPYRRSMTEDALAETCSGCTGTRVGWSR